MNPAPPSPRVPSIWVSAALYFAFYVPYSSLTKAVSSGSWSGAPVAGTALLPLSTLAGVVVMVAFLLVTGWWRHAHRAELGGLSLPAPTWVTFVSGLCTAAILTTTTLAYTFEGVSIVLMMLLMRGGVLVIAPIVDLLTGRRPQAESWVGLALCLAALFAAFSGDDDYQLSAAALLNLGIYLTSYFVRFQFMSRFAKTRDRAATLRYFVEEQLVVAPATLLVVGLAAALGGGWSVAADLRAGMALPAALALPTLTLGVCSQLVGIFGTLVFLDPRENSFSTPVNRAASVLAGVAAAWVLTVWAGGSPPKPGELWGAALIVVAIGALAGGPLLRRHAAGAAAKPG